MRKRCVSVIVGLTLLAGHLGCAKPDLGNEPLPVVDDPRRGPQQPAERPEPPKTTEPIWEDAGPGPTGTTADAGPTPKGRINCAETTTCASPRKATIAGIPGDDTLVPLEMRGSTSEFVQLRITESSSLWYDLKLKATLTSPPGTNFDLVVYVPPADTATDCSNFAAASSLTSGEDVVRTTWSDSTFSDDSRNVVFEIRNVSGDCSSNPDARWVLKIQGYVD